MDSLIAVVELDENARRIVPRLGEPRFDRPYSGWYWQIAAGSAPLLQSRSLWNKRLPLASSEGAEPLSPTSAARTKSTLRLVEREVGLPAARGASTSPSAATAARSTRDPQLQSTLAWSLASSVLACWPRCSCRCAMASAAAPHAPGHHRRANRQGGAAGRRVPGRRSCRSPARSTRCRAQRRRAGARTHAGQQPRPRPEDAALRSHQRSRPPAPVACRHRKRQSTHAPPCRPLSLARPRRRRRAGARRAHRVAPVVEDLRRTLEQSISTARRVDVGVAPDLAFRGERQDLEEMPATSDNACKWAHARVRRRAAPDSDVYFSPSMTTDRAWRPTSARPSSPAASGSTSQVPVQALASPSCARSPNSMTARFG